MERQSTCTNSYRGKELWKLQRPSLQKGTRLRQSHQIFFPKKSGFFGTDGIVDCFNYFRA